ncbi:ROK family transcriptional regulator [Corynebacterium vitaeruminis]|nr:ROK family transcriptional regulator [Corynebacterium vitaeruminis]
MTTSIMNKPVYFSFPDTPVARVFHQIRTTASDRTLLQRQLGYSQASITRHVASLMEAGLVEEVSAANQEESRTGRPRITLGIDGGHLTAWGAHVGVSSTEIVVCDVGGRIIRQRRLPLATKKLAPEDHLRTVSHELERLSVGLPQPVDVGIAFSSHVNHHGFVDSSEYGWHDINVCSLLSEIFNRSVSVSTGVLAMAGAEISDTPLAADRREAPLLPSTLYFYAREIVNHAWIFNGVVHRPHSGKAPSIYRPETPSHASPLSVSGIIDEATAQGLRTSSFADLVRHSQHCTPIKELFRARAEALGDAVAAAVEFVDPEVVVFAGEAFTLDPDTLRVTVSRVRHTAHPGAQLRIHNAGRNILQRAASQVALSRFRNDPLLFS